MSKEALSDLKIADFSWVLAGPIVTKHLADYGATVVRIESRQRLDIMRATMPYKDGKPGLDRGGYYAFFNSNKYDMELDIANPEGKEIARKLVGWSDIVVENFAPGAMEKLGFSFEALKAIKEDIIMLRLSNQGQTGPYSHYASLGNQLNALAGFVHFTGWPDREPLSLSLAYSDYFCPWFAVSALMAAVEHRRQTGQGQLIDFSQFEASLQFVGPYLLEYSANGAQGQRLGNAHPFHAPHAAYRCAGDDRWCAIAVSDEPQWRAFCQAVGEPSWSSEPRFATMVNRKKNEAELNILIEAWTSERRAEDVMEILQKHGVPAGVVKNAQDIFEDPQLKARGHLWLMEHNEIGPFHHLGQPSILSETPAQPKMPAPCLGEHTEYVCTKILGMADDEFTRLVSSGAFGKT
jgi:benzylsuccinate CoA-transferase BbsF subunit